MPTLAGKEVNPVGYGLMGMLFFHSSDDPAQGELGRGEIIACTLSREN
jgi:hypothetical protein